MKDLKINKELLQCLNKHLTIDEVISNDKNRIDNNIYWNVKEIDILQSKNIYELAYKCKEWALSKGYIINSGVTTSNDWCCTIYKIIKEIPYIKELSHTWEQSEPEAIFKACNWILEKEIQEENRLQLQEDLTEYTKLIKEGL